MKATPPNVFLLIGVLLLFLSALPAAAQEAEDPAGTVVGAPPAETDTEKKEESKDQGPGFWKKVFRGEGESDTSGSHSYAGGIPASLRTVQEILRDGPLQNEPKARFYMDLVERDQASPAQMATFGSYLTQKGIHQAAIEYYKEAVRREPDNPHLWINTGTVYRLLDDDESAVGAYKKAVELDPFIAEAHYNLGATYDELNAYDEAVEEFMLALTLDPSLGDPAVNPQVVTNQRMTVVQLLLYQRQLGTRGLPMMTIEAD